MYLIGLTGGIASGKSAVAKRLSELGAVVVDADQVAREVVEIGQPALAQIAETFGASVIASDGSLDRAALAAIVFSDEEKRLALNAITHPAVWQRTRELFGRAGAADPNAIVVYDVPLLAEAAADRPFSFDQIVVVHADVDVRIERMVINRGMSRDEAANRINSQATDAERLAIADVVIDNNGDLDDTLRQVDDLWASIRESR